MRKIDISLKINSKIINESVIPRMSLLDFIREKANLKGTHTGCEHGVCGACTVIFEGDPVRSCSLLAVQANGKSVITVEGLGNEDGTTSILQDAFCDTHAMQCGYCISGMLISAHALLECNSAPTLEDIKAAIGGNICRCTGYVQIIEAIQLAASRLVKAQI